MSDKITLVFSSILSFVKELHDTFPEQNNNPLSLYYRLTSNFQAKDEKGMQRCIQGFTVFFNSCGDHIASGQLENIPGGTRIFYHDNDRIYIDITRYISKSNPETRKCIHMHLLSIMAMITRNKEAVAALKMQEQDDMQQANPFGQIMQGIDETSPEGKMMKDVMSKLHDSTANLGNMNANNPMEGFQQLMSSGFLPNMMKTLSDSSQSGADPAKVARLLYNAIGNLLPPETNNPPVALEAPKSGKKKRKALPPSEPVD